MAHPRWSEVPELFAELDMSKDTGYTIRGRPASIVDFSPSSPTKLPWKCRICDHEWLARSGNRLTANNGAGAGCPACANRALHIDGRNSLAQANPQLASEYVGDPNLVVATTSKPLPWKCNDCGHEWNAPGQARMRGIRNCLMCARANFNPTFAKEPISVTYPELAKELVPGPYGDANTLIGFKHLKLTWKCSVCDNIYQAKGSNRTSMGSGCGYCASRSTKIHSDGRNSMFSTHPQLADELQPNQYGTAHTLVAGTAKRLPWKCSTCDHEWIATGNSRAVNNQGCGACAGSAFHSGGLNSLAHLFPDLAAEMISNDADLSADQITAYTVTVRATWRCTDCSHEWSTLVRSRSNGGSNCPHCSEVTTGFQSHLPGYYYVHEILNEEGDRILLKGGIAGDWQKRFVLLRRGLPRGLTIRNVEAIHFDTGQDARDLETRLLRVESIRAPARDFDGGTELFMSNPLDYARTYGWV